MASYGQLQADIKAYLKRQDIDDRIPSWVQATETDIAEMLRARAMVVRSTQLVDADFISLPTDFIKFESVATSCCGAMLSLEDHWTGPHPGGANCWCGYWPGDAVSAYRIVGSCIEFLPHPSAWISSPNWVPQQLQVTWYAKPKPLKIASDTNAILEQHYQIYLFGCVRYGAMWGMDDDRETQMTTRFSEAVAVANRWKEDAEFSGAPLRAVVRSF